ncbi:hypothetical protein CDAR_19581 [Caerostris darwini]|uniref:Secreted protein n=1 Tax=Caerostris darwini TaxID=1538125 RepID=A0AAV4WCR7_9ARAC|nr:hypothetical protein CDAR_19581 [Caerostris darwini]
MRKHLCCLLFLSSQELPEHKKKSPAVRSIRTVAHQKEHQCTLACIIEIDSHRNFSVKLVIDSLLFTPPPPLHLFFEAASSRKPQQLPLSRVQT